MSIYLFGELRPHTIDEHRLRFAAVMDHAHDGDMPAPSTAGHDYSHYPAHQFDFDDGLRIEMVKIAIGRRVFVWCVPHISPAYREAHPDDAISAVNDRIGRHIVDVTGVDLKYLESSQTYLELNPYVGPRDAPSVWRIVLPAWPEHYCHWCRVDHAGDPDYATSGERWSGSFEMNERTMQLPCIQALQQRITDAALAKLAEASDGKPTSDLPCWSPVA